MTDQQTEGLGRRYDPDDRDGNYLLSDHIPRTLAMPRTKYWMYAQQPLDQGREGTCVGHGWKHCLMAGPIKQTKPSTYPTAITIYLEACKVDPWQENDNGDLQFGTSVRAGAKALHSRGLISEYAWAWDLRTCIDYLLIRGPVVIGVNFYEQMRRTDKQGFMRVGGDLLGGHCMLLLGVNENDRVVRGLNSWGRDFGQNGRFWMDYPTLDRLIGEFGEICAPVEARPR